jgi:uncharacterized membrane protein YgcG
VTALNPKSIAFFVAFVPQFLNPAAPLMPQFAILIASFVSLAAVNALAYALLADTLRARLARPAVMAWLVRAGGATLVGMGVLTATLAPRTGLRRDAGPFTRQAAGASGRADRGHGGCGAHGVRRRPGGCHAGGGGAGPGPGPDPRHAAAARR